MNSTAPRRPPLLTAACTYLGVMAAIQSIRAITLVSTWNAEDGADKVSPQLEVLRDSGISQASAESGYKVFLTVLAVLAAAGVVFAIYTARGDRASRVGLTVVMGLVGLFFFLGATGGSFFDAVIGALAIAFTVRLWTGESRAWFRTLATGEPAPVAAAAAVRPDPFASSPAAQAPQAPQAPQPTQQAEHPSYQQAEQPARPQPPADKLPTSVGIAVWTALVGSIVAGLGSALMLLALVVVGTDYDDVIAQGGMGADMIRGQEGQFNTAVRFLVVMSSIALVAAAGGLFAAIRVLVTKRSGDVVLFVMTVVTLVVSVIGFPLGIPWTVAAVVALIQLRRPESKQWFVKT